MDQSSGGPRPYLVVHMDLNETIMAEDTAGGDGYEETLHKVRRRTRSPRALGQAEPL